MAEECLNYFLAYSYQQPKENYSDHSLAYCWKLYKKIFQKQQKSQKIIVHICFTSLWTFPISLRRLWKMHFFFFFLLQGAVEGKLKPTSWVGFNSCRFKCGLLLPKNRSLFSLDIPDIMWCKTCTIRV